MVRVDGSTLPRNEQHVPAKRASQRLHLDFNRLANTNGRHERLRYRQAQTKRADLRQADERHCLRLRGGSRLNHRPDVCIPFCYRASKRRSDRDVVAKRSEPRFFGFGDLRSLLLHAQLRFRRGDLGFGDQISRTDLVDFLLGDQPGSRFADFLKPGIGKMGDLMRAIPRAATHPELRRSRRQSARPSRPLSRLRRSSPEFRVPRGPALP